MLKKTITYTDYNDTTRTETFYFNLSKAEIMQMETAVAGGLTGRLQSFMDKQDIPSLMDFFETFILKAYGVRSEDGRRFVKSKELSEEFKQTEAYSELYMELLTNPDTASAFVTGLLPKDVADEVAKEMDKQQALGNN